MTLSIKAILISMLTVLCIGMNAQDKAHDAFAPIGKYFAMGDAEKLSAWFSDNLEVTIFSTSNDSSRSQARQILKSSFSNIRIMPFSVVVFPVPGPPVSTIIPRVRALLIASFCRV